MSLFGKFLQKCYLLYIHVIFCPIYLWIVDDVSDGSGDNEARDDGKNDGPSFSGANLRQKEQA